MLWQALLLWQASLLRQALLLSSDLLCRPANIMRVCTAGTLVALSFQKIITDLWFRIVVLEFHLLLLLVLLLLLILLLLLVYTHSNSFVSATKGKTALLAVGVNFTLIELDECGESRNGDIQKILHSINGCATVPNIISSNGFIGGGSETEALHKNGQLKGILEAAGCAFGK